MLDELKHHGYRIGPAFTRAKGAYMACHVAEDVAFINDQPLFRAPVPTQMVPPPETTLECRLNEHTG